MTRPNIVPTTPAGHSGQPVWPDQTVIAGKAEPDDQCEGRMSSGRRCPEKGDPFCATHDELWTRNARADYLHLYS